MEGLDGRCDSCLEEIRWRDQGVAGVGERSGWVCQMMGGSQQASCCWGLRFLIGVTVYMEEVLFVEMGNFLKVE